MVWERPRERARLRVVGDVEAAMDVGEAFKTLRRTARGFRAGGYDGAEKGAARERQDEFSGQSGNFTEDRVGNSVFGPL